MKKGVLYSLVFVALGSLASWEEAIVYRSLLDELAPARELSLKDMSDASADDESTSSQGGIEAETEADLRS